jgi:hypothetical protein
MVCAGIGLPANADCIVDMVSPENWSRPQRDRDDRLKPGVHDARQLNLRLNEPLCGAPYWVHPVTGVMNG